MTADSTSSSQPRRPATRTRRPGIARLLRVVLWLLTVSVFAQPVFASLFLDRHNAWRDWHATNGMLVLPLLALIQVVLDLRPCGHPARPHPELDPTLDRPADLSKLQARHAASSLATMTGTPWMGAEALGFARAGHAFAPGAGPRCADADMEVEHLTASVTIAPAD